MDKRISFEQAVKTKRDAILVRPRVNRLLEQASEHALVTVTAGTGYGKTQAVHTFLEQSSIHHLWLHLTSLDNYPVRFWDVFCKAFSHQNPTLAEKLQALGFPDSLDKTYNFLRIFSADVYKKGRCVLVLDDFQKITDASIIQFVETLCFTGIENLSVFLLTRHPLMLDYSGLHTKGLIASVSGTELRFTADEVQAFYSQAGYAFTPQEAEEIWAATEGWPLAIYLIGLHYRQAGGIFRDPIECSIPLLYSIIEQDIFSQYPKPAQDIFIKLSLLESIPLQLVQSLAGNLYADMAAYLRQNMFVSYNAHTNQYHFHRLYRRFLQAKLVTLSEEELQRVYLTIGDWFRDQGTAIEALTFYDKCDNDARRWQIIRQFGSRGFSSELAQLCITQLDKLSPEFIEANPLVRPMRAFMLLNSGEVELAYRHNIELMEEYESLTPTPARREILGEVYIQLAHLSIMQSSYSFVQYYRLAAENLPYGSAIVQRHHLYVGSNSCLNLFSTKAGELDAYVSAMRDVMPLAARVMNGCGTGAELLAAAEAALIRTQLEQAATFAQQAIDNASAMGQYDIVFNAGLIIMRVCFAQGNYDETFRQLELMREYAAKVEDQYLYGMDDIAEGWLFAHIQHAERVASWIISPSQPRNRIFLSVGKEKVVHALCLLQNKEYYELIALLDFMEKRYSLQGLHLLMLHVHILRALALHKMGNRTSALASFQKAYELSYANGIVMPFVEYDSDMRTLLDAIQAVPGHGMDDAWLAALYTKTCSYSKKRTYIAKEFERRNRLEKAVFSTLTPRETEVLAVLCKGLTREEIAIHFTISINTVKTTLKNIFSKLGAINRADAIRIAKDYHLVD